jgi:UDP-N-acetylmuramate: L-alanyl-gamma-D-glutamyl-meso-diaminopimelate ligase
MKKAAGQYYLEKREALSDATDRMVVTPDIDIGSIKKIHLTGICGKAMASLAGLLVAAGYTVTGSDSAWNPPMSTVLEHIGIGFQPFDAKNLNDIDLVVIGNASAPSNIEAVAARERNVPQISSAEAYALFFIQQSRSIVITGTHGKTTTSSLATHVFVESGKKTNALIGGVLRNSGESYNYAQAAQYSVVEGDEYDTAYFDKAPKFLHYRPTIGVITSIEFDHVDIYRDMEDYLAAFVFFAQEIPVTGYLLISESVKEAYRENITSLCESPVYTYGFSNTCEIRGENLTIDQQRGGQVFDITVQGKSYKDFFIPMFGSYNAENAISVAGIALIEGISEHIIKKSLATFKGAEQRQEILFNRNDIIVIDDFAHHPTAVAVTTQGIRDQYPDKRIIALFEPRSVTSRRKDFEIPYSTAFDAVDIAIIAKPPVKSVDDQNNMMDTEKVVSLIKERITDAMAFPHAVDIFEEVKKIIAPGDVIIIMSNGHFDGLSEMVVEWLEKNH